MKRFFTILFLLFFSISSGFASEIPVTYSTQDTVRFILSIVLKNTQMDFKDNEYALLVHLCNKYENPDSLKVYPDQYRKKLNDFYYKRFFLYSKLVGSNEVVTSDCLKEEETGQWHQLRKLLFYSIYDGPTWNFPADYVQKIEQYSTEDPFYGPVNALVNIYLLKEYNWEKLTAADRTNIADLEKRLAINLNKNYIESKDWGYNKVYALWAIRINKIPVAEKVNTDELLDYFDRKYWMVRFLKDYENEKLMNREGGQYTTYISNLCTYWLFTLNR